MQVILDNINICKTTLIGYNAMTDQYKDELLKNISYFEITEIDSSFSIKQTIRDIKLNSILKTNINYTHLLIDSSTILRGLEGTNSISSSSNYRHFIEHINVVLDNTDIKLIITSLTSTNIATYRDSTPSDYKFKGGTSALYAAKYAICFRSIKSGIYIDVIKNRNGESTYKIKVNDSIKQTCEI